MSTAKMFVPASLIIALATVVLGAQASVAEPAADECKTTPGSSAPLGQHWYYRVNRSDQRHCWYLGAESTKVRAQTREKASSSPAGNRVPTRRISAWGHKEPEFFFLAVVCEPCGCVFFSWGCPDGRRVGRLFRYLWTRRKRRAKFFTRV